jgi:hypothetical protein
MGLLDLENIRIDCFGETQEAAGHHRPAGGPRAGWIFIVVSKASNPT